MEQKRNPRISIVTVTFNCASVIEENIQSIIKESDVEAIIVDNNSQDNTKQIIEPYLNERVKLIANNTNKGFTEGNNLGIKAAKGQYILFLNPDASLIPGVIHKLADYLDENLQFGAVVPSLLFPDGSAQNYTRRFPTPAALWVESFVPQKYWNAFPCYKKFTCQHLDFSKPREVEQPAGAAILFRNQWLLDEYYFNYVSDVDLCKTIIKDGFSIVQIPHLHFVHHQSKGGTENKELRTILDLDNYHGMRYYFRKHGQNYYAIIYTILFTVSLFTRWIIAPLMNKSEQDQRWFKFKMFLLNKDIKQLYV